MIAAKILRPIRAIAAMAMACLLLACATEPTKPAGEKPKDEPPKLIGRIASIPPGKPFVLVQFYESTKQSNGTILTSRGDDNRTANLLLTGEKLGQFAAADIQSGSVEAGDAVYSVHSPAAKPEAPNAPETDVLPPAEAPETTPSEPLSLPSDAQSPDSVQKFN
jgi:hypothetical protein